MHTRAGQDDESLALDGHGALIVPATESRVKVDHPGHYPNAPDRKHGVLLPKLGVWLLLFHVFRPLF